MLSYGYWQRRFGGDPKVIGRRIMADGVAREIIGVLPKDFWFMDMGHDLLMPLRYDRSTVRLAGYNFQAIARLRPGVTIQQANADVARMIGIELDKFPPPNGMSKQMMEDARLGPECPAAPRRSARRYWQKPLGGDGDNRDRLADRLRQRGKSTARPYGGPGTGIRRTRRSRRRPRAHRPRDVCRESRSCPDGRMSWRRICLRRREVGVEA